MNGMSLIPEGCMGSVAGGVAQSPGGLMTLSPKTVVLRRNSFPGYRCKDSKPGYQLPPVPPRRLIGSLGLRTGKSVARGQAPANAAWWHVGHERACD